MPATTDSSFECRATKEVDVTKVDKQRIVELLDRRGETGTAAQAESLLPPEVDPDIA